MTTYTFNLAAAGVTTDDERKSAALVLAAVRQLNGDPEVTETTLREAANELAAGGNVGGVLVDFATGLAETFRPLLDAGATVDDVRQLLRESVGSAAGEAATSGETAA